MQGQELAEPGQQRVAGQVRRGCHTQGADQRAAVFGDLGFPLGQQVEGALGVVQQRLAMGRQAHGAGGALKKSRAQLRLQPLERGAGSCGCDAQRSSGTGQAAAARRVDQHI